MKRFIVFFTLVISVSAICQPKKVVLENSLFWEVSGKDLQQPTYLFGTFHLLGNSFVDSLGNVSNKFRSSKIMVSEMLIDSGMMMKVMAASQLKGTTLDKLLTAEDYQHTALWLKELSGYDLKMFNTMNPITVQVFIMTMLQQQKYPIPNQQPMDLYFQQTARKAGKKIVGLESIDVQINALYGQFTPQRQAELLTEFVKNKDKAVQEMEAMNVHYRKANWPKLEEMMTTQGYKESETKIFLDDRNLNWVDQLPAIMKEGPAFVAVGALHLTGETGLVNQLRKLGYKVMPIPLN
ncbi:MAG: TraB/GumN family protein [Flammeovirgaceae bacterium]|nr:TraB/GumN family protein [Flammeovirgaceae bacterium]